MIANLSISCVYECDPNKRPVILDDYVAQSKPKPAMLVYIYPYYVESYNEVENRDLA